MADLRSIPDKVSSALGLSSHGDKSASSLASREKSLQDARSGAASASGALKCTPQSLARTDPTLPMKAAEWRGTRKVVLATRASPCVTDPEDAVIRITSSSVCGTDLHPYQNEVPGKAFKEGDILGHECMGVVESVGANVGKFQPGQRVVVSAVLSCGSCGFCSQGKTSMCPTLNPSGEAEQQMGARNAGLLGIGHLNGGFSGCQAERVRVPFAAQNLLAVPDSLTDAQALLLSDIACTGWHGCELAQVREGCVVGVWGGGPVGIMTAYLAKHVRGALRVILIDGNEYRLRFAQSLGIETLNYHDSPDVIAAMHVRVPGGLDCAVDCAGFRYPRGALHKVLRAVGAESDSPEIFAEMAHVAKPGGHIALIGEYFQTANAFPIGLVMQKDLTVRGGPVYLHSYWHSLLRRVQLGKIDLQMFLTHQMRLGDIERAYEMFDKREDEVIKIQLVTDFGLEQGPKLGAVRPLSQRNLPPYNKDGSASITLPSATATPAVSSK